jgi:hypothetical protein
LCPEYADTHSTRIGIMPSSAQSISGDGQAATGVSVSKVFPRRGDVARLACRGRPSDAQRRRIAEGGPAPPAGLNGSVTLKAILDRALE